MPGSLLIDQLAAARQREFVGRRRELAAFEAGQSADAVINALTRAAGHSPGDAGLIALAELLNSVLLAPATTRSARRTTTRPTRW